MSSSEFTSISELQSSVVEAYTKRTGLRIVGNNSKFFYGNLIEAEPLQVNIEPGILEYEPSELYVTASAATCLSDINSALAEKSQQLAFDPPDYNGTSTVGGSVATGLSGSRRPFSGALRDHLLGIEGINGKGELVSLGGRVMKNVAGYDACRLMAGALGTLAIITKVTFKVTPKACAEKTIKIAVDAAERLDEVHRIRFSRLPLSAMFADNHYIYCRLSGGVKSVDDACNKLGGEIVDDGDRFWKSIDIQEHDAFNESRPLWRISVPVSTGNLEIDGKQLIDWAGGIRWLFTDIDCETISSTVKSAGGHATLFKNFSRPEKGPDSVFHSLGPLARRIHEKLKLAFDPAGILNPGIMYKEF